MSYFSLVKIRHKIDNIDMRLHAVECFDKETLSFSYFFITNHRKMYSCKIEAQNR